jgi:predicted phosphodiesterase
MRISVNHKLKHRAQKLEPVRFEDPRTWLGPVLAGIVLTLATLVVFLVLHWLRCTSQDRIPDTGLTNTDYNHSMKLGLISDVHGNVQALRAVLTALEEDGAEFVICAGDLVAYGANPSQVIKLLRDRAIPCVAGNYDFAVAHDLKTASRISSSPTNEPLKRAALAWAQANTSSGDKRFLGSLPWRMDFVMDGLHISMLHAGVEYLDAMYTPNEPEAMFALYNRMRTDVIVMGHSHQSFTYRAQAGLMVNPGSVGRSLNGDPRAAYAILDTASLEVAHRRVRYDLRGAVRAIEKSGMPLEIARLVEHGARRIEDVPTITSMPETAARGLEVVA